MTAPPRKGKPHEPQGDETTHTGQGADSALSALIKRRVPAPKAPADPPAPSAPPAPAD